MDGRKDCPLWYEPEDCPYYDFSTGKCELSCPEDDCTDYIENN